MPTQTQGTFINGRGQNLHTVEWQPDCTRPRAVLFFHHGYGEHTGRFETVFSELAEAGIAVHSYDCHGHGRSEPQDEQDRFLIWDFNHVVDDLVAFTKHIKTRYDSSVPVFLGGHSMGSLASIHVALRDQTAWDGLVLGTATVDVEWNWLLRLQASIGNILAMLIPRAKIVPAPTSKETTSADIAEKIARDPLLAAGAVRARTGNEMLKAFSHVRRNGHLLWLPIYSHHGTADHLASITAVKKLLDRCASPDVTMHEVDGGAHELFMGMERELVTQHVISWVQKQIRSDVASIASEVSERALNSMRSWSGNPFEWQPAGGSPLGGSPLGGSPLGGSPFGGSPLGSPRFSARAYSGAFPEDANLWQEAR